MKPETSKVRLLMPDGGFLEGKFVRWEEDPDDSDSVRLELEFDGRRLSSASEGFFDAMASIRKDLESIGLLLDCYGASLNVFPSPMIRSMGPGEKAYRLTPGSPARTEDLVSIFETGADSKPATVMAQQEFYKQWTESLGRRFDGEAGEK